MMVMTAKVNLKKILIILGIIAAVIIGCILIFGGSGDQPTAATVSDNDSRVAFLQSFGWQVATSPVSSGQVRIPDKSSAVFDRYNELQKSQGYDLTKFAGQTVMRYVYKVTNYPGATEPVYATVLVLKDQIIGGDVTNTGPKGVVRGFRFPEVQPADPTEQETTT